MRENNASVIIKEYYNIVSPILVFASCDKINEMERRVLMLLCESKMCKDLFDECWAMIDNARCLQTYTDGALFLPVAASEHCVAYDIKMEILSLCKIAKVRNFDEFTFTEDLKHDANVGKKNACKLLAFLSWLGVLLPQKRETAINIWSMLAMSGDRTAIEMLIYAYTKTDNKEELEKWNHICDILDKEFDSFSAIAQHSHYPDYTEGEVEIANLIMYIFQKNPAKSATTIDRPMLYYVLYSADDYSAKMQMLSEDANYFLAMHAENRLSDKEYGF